MIRSIQTALVVAAIAILGACGGGGADSSTPEAASTAPVAMTKVAGDAQTLAQHTAISQALQVRVTDVLNNGVPGVRITFAPHPGSAYVLPSTIATDANGLAAWAGYLHAAGPQLIDASSPGLATLTFTATITASGRPFDGEYIIYDAQGKPLFAELSHFFIQNSTVPATTMIGPYINSFSETTGQLDMRYHADLINSFFVSGPLVLESSGRVTGSGSITRGTVGNVTPAGTWNAERQ